MELTVRIAYEELLALIQQLPKAQITLLQQELEKITTETPSVDSEELKNLVLAGPVMSDDQYKAFQDFRAEMNTWRET